MTECEVLKTHLNNRIHFPVTTCLVIDGNTIVQTLKPTDAKKFDYQGSQIFLRYLATKLKQVSIKDLVCGTYNKGILKVWKE